MRNYRVVFSTPLHFQYSNEETSAAMFYLDFFLKSSSVWLPVVFHYGTENREEQIKKTPCRSNKRPIYLKECPKPED